MAKGKRPYSEVMQAVRLPLLPTRLGTITKVRILAQVLIRTLVQVRHHDYNLAFTYGQSTRLVAVIYTSWPRESFLPIFDAGSAEEALNRLNVVSG